MRPHRDFEIAHVGLKPGEHKFSYHLKESFFEEFGQTEFRDADFDVQLLLDKKTNFYQLKFSATGSLTVTCDRCGEDFTLELWDDFEAIIKVVDSELAAQRDMEDGEIIYIPQSANYLDIAPILYENLVLALPMQIVHPNDENGQSMCNPEALKLLGEYSAYTNEDTNQVKQNALLEQLEKLKKKKDAKS